MPFQSTHLPCALCTFLVKLKQQICRRHLHCRPRKRLLQGEGNIRSWYLFFQLGDWVWVWSLQIFQVAFLKGALVTCTMLPRLVGRRMHPRFTVARRDLKGTTPLLIFKQLNCGVLRHHLKKRSPWDTGMRRTGCYTLSFALLCLKGSENL